MAIDEHDDATIEVFTAQDMGNMRQVPYLSTDDPIEKAIDEMGGVSANAFFSVFSLSKAPILKIGQYPIEAAADLEELIINDDPQGGLYKITLYVEGKIHKVFKKRIRSQALALAPRQGGSSDVLEAMREQTALIARLVEDREHAREPVDPMQQITNMVAMMQAMKELVPAPPPPLPEKSLVDSMKEMMVMRETMADFFGGDDDPPEKSGFDFSAMAAPAMQILASAMAEKETQAARPYPQPTPNSAPDIQGETIDHDNGDSDEMLSKTRLKAGLGHLLTQAEMGSSPQQIAQMALTNLGDDDKKATLSLLSGDDYLANVIALNTGFSEHGEWLGEFRRFFLQAEKPNS